MFTPIEQNKAFIQIATQIRSLINQGKLKPGDKLPSERELADSFKASRATVREALRALEVNDMIYSRVGQGTFIKVSSLSDMDQLLSEIENQTSPLQVFEARTAIEPYLAYLASYNATDEDIKSIEDCLEKTELELNDFEKFEYWDGVFHQNIAYASKNTFLVKFMSILNDVRLEKLWGSMKKRSLTIERIYNYHQSHKNIFYAIQNRESNDAEKQMTKHIIHVKKNLFEQ